MTIEPHLDLVVLVADKDLEEAIKGLLSRPASLRIRPLRTEVRRHPQRDPGCRLRPEDLLALYANRARHALVVFEYEGSGGEGTPPEEIEDSCRSRLERKGWEDRAEVLVISPELEAWVWSDSPHVDEQLGWRGRQPGLRAWMEAEALWMVENSKPSRPKEALERVLTESRLPRSAAIYGNLARRVGLQRCTDESFVRLRKILQSWFPQT